MDTMVNDTTILLSDNVTINSGEENSLWMYIAIALCLVIIGILLSRNDRKSKRSELKKKILSENSVDFSNVISSSFQAKALYDELKKKCHPDKYKDQKLNSEATEIFQLLVKYKYDYNKLQELKDRAIKNLNIQ